LRGLAEVYGTIIFALIAAVSIAALYHVTTQGLQASAVLDARLSDFATISASYNPSSGLCISVNSTKPIEKVIIDQGASVIVTRVGFANTYRGCFSVDAYKPTAVIVETSAGLHIYDPGLDPRYRGCAPVLRVFKPYMLEEMSTRCSSYGAGAAGVDDSAVRVEASYLDPVFVALLGPRQAERYRGYIPSSGPALQSSLNLAVGSPVGVVEEPRYTLLNASGLVAVTATAYHPVNVCVYLYDHPAYRDICSVTKRGFVYEYRYNLSLAEERRLPVEAWYIVRLPGSDGPGAYLVVGDGYVAAGGNWRTPGDYVEAVVVEPNGSVNVLEWGRVSEAGDGPHTGWVKLSGCTPRALRVGNVTISTQCYGLRTGYPYTSKGYMLITYLVVDGILNMTFMYGKGENGYYFTIAKAASTTLSIVNLTYTVAKVDEGMPGTYRVTSMGSNSTLLYSFAQPRSTGIYPYWILGLEPASSTTDSVLIAVNMSSTIFEKAAS